MKLLQICNKLPFPATDGGAIAMDNVGRGLLSAGVDLTVFALVTPKTIDVFGKVTKEYREKVHLCAPFIDTSVKPLGAFLNLFSGTSYNLERFYSKQVEAELIKVLKSFSFDVIQLESIFVSPYLPVIRKYSNAKVVLRAHNVEFRIWDRLSATSANPLKRWYLSLMASRLKKEEIQALSAVDGIATITELDRETIISLGINKPVEVIPFGLEVNHLCPSYSVNSDLFHLGAMDWLPNLEGVNWLVDKVVPRLHSKNYTLYLAGKGMPDAIFKRRSDNIRVEGVVHDAVKFMEDKSIMVVPLLSGGGMRVKIIEGMALGKAIVSTSIGAEGISCENGTNILIGDSPEEFAECIEKCLNDKELCRKLGENARKLAEERYDNNVITTRLISFYNKLEK